MSSRSMAAIVLAAAFFAGAATTLGVLRLVEHQREPDAAFGRPPFPDDDSRPRGGERPGNLRIPGPFFDRSGRYTEMARTRVTNRMARALQLTGEQREAIEAAMDRQHVAAQQAMADVLPRLHGFLDSLHAEIDGILTGEQREAFREFRRQDRDRFRRQGSRWFRRPGRNGWR